MAASDDQLYSLIARYVRPHEEPDWPKLYHELKILDDQPVQLLVQCAVFSHQSLAEMRSDIRSAIYAGTDDFKGIIKPIHHEALRELDSKLTSLVEAAGQFKNIHRGFVVGLQEACGQYRSSIQEEQRLLRAELDNHGESVRDAAGEIKSGVEAFRQTLPLMRQMQVEVRRQKKYAGLTSAISGTVAGLALSLCLGIYTYFSVRGGVEATLAEHKQQVEQDIAQQVAAETAQKVMDELGLDKETCQVLRAYNHSLTLRAAGPAGDGTGRQELHLNLNRKLLGRIYAPRKEQRP